MKIWLCQVNKSLFQYFTAIQQFFYYPIEFSVQSSLLNDYISFQAVKSEIYMGISNGIRNERYSIPYEMKGYMVEEKIIEIQIPPALYRCNDGSYIKELSMCDNILDCADGEDEMNCKCHHDPSCSSI